jgi:putative transcriptional regulator
MKNIIQQVLSAKKMTQSQLADRVGIKREYLNKIINSRITPTVGLALRIGQALDMQVEELFSALELEKRHAPVTENQDKIINFMLQEGLDISDMYNAIYFNQQRFMDRLLERIKEKSGP